MFGFLNHIDLNVSDLDRSIEFYEAVLSLLGFARTNLYAGGAPCWAIANGSGSGFSMALHPARSDAAHDRYSVGLHHFAFHATSREEVDLLHSQLRALEVQILDPPAEYDYTPGYYAVFFADPDGIKLEIVYEPRFATA